MGPNAGTHVVNKQRHKRWKTTRYWDEHWGDLSQAEIGEISIACTPQNGRPQREAHRQDKTAATVAPEPSRLEPDACVELHTQHQAKAKHYRRRLAVRAKRARDRKICRQGRSTPQPLRTTTTRDATVNRRKTPSTKNKHTTVDMKGNTARGAGTKPPGTTKKKKLKSKGKRTLGKSYMGGGL